MTKEELRERVEARKEELTAEETSLTRFREKVTAFVEDIKGRSVIYNLVKNLPIWKELENLVGGE